MTSHISDLIRQKSKVSANGSLVEESTLSRRGSVYIPHYLAITVFADFEGANSPWVQWRGVGPLFRDNDSRVLPLDDPAMVAGEGIGPSTFW